MAFAQKEKMDLPAYFDSQAQAAAMLGISIHDVKSAKAAGCRALYGGRIRAKELQAWLRVYDEDTPSVNWPDRSCRRQPLFELIEFLSGALYEKQVSFKKFCAIGDKTIPLIIKLGRAVDARIDEPGYRKCWRY